MKSKKHGFVFPIASKDVEEVVKSGLIVVDLVSAPRLFAVKKGDYVFAYDVKGDVLWGAFEAVSEPYYVPDEKRPFYLKVQPLGEVRALRKASQLFKKLGVSWKSSFNEKGALYLKRALKHDFSPKAKGLVDVRYRPPIFTTTLWDFPTQSYGLTPKGDNAYPGVTPAFVVYNVVWRYSKPGDLVCDPTAGSGTTIDVCLEEGRKVVAFDVAPTRKDVVKADARRLPLKDESVDLVFLDPPYGDNLLYNDHPLNLGKLPATSKEFYDELEKVFVECFRVLKKGKTLAVLIGDQWAKGVYVPVGFYVYERLTKYFEPVDVVCVVRRSQTSNTPLWHARALRLGFYLRGFKYLIVVKKPAVKKECKLNVYVKWKQYERKRGKERKTISEG